MNIEYLYKKIELLSNKDFFKFETDFYIYLSKYKEIPFANAFLIISSWFGTSERNGVWTFYEATEKAEIQKAVLYLKEHKETELANIIEKGIHDYQNPIYENCDYPDEWLEEAEEIDNWIQNNRDWLLKWLYTFILNNKEQIIGVSKMKNNIAELISLGKIPKDEEMSEDVFNKYDELIQNDEQPTYDEAEKLITMFSDDCYDLNWGLMGLIEKITISDDNERYKKLISKCNNEEFKEIMEIRFKNYLDKQK